MKLVCLPSVLATQCVMYDLEEDIYLAQVHETVVF